MDQFIIVNSADLGPGTYPITVEASNEFGCSHADAIFVTVFDCTTGIEEADGGLVGHSSLQPAGDGAAGPSVGGPPGPRSNTPGCAMPSAGPSARESMSRRERESR